MTKQALFDRLPGMVYRCDYRPGGEPHGRLLYTSDGATALTGYDANELLAGLCFTDCIYLADRESVAEKIALAAQENGQYTCTYRLQTVQEDIRWVQDRGAIIEEDGEQYLEGIIVDATSQVKRLQQLEKQVALRTRRLAALYDVTELAHTLTDLRAGLLQALEPVLAVTRAEVGIIHVLDPAGENFYLAAQQGLPDSLSVGLSCLSATSEPLATIVTSKSSLHIKRVDGDERTKLLQSYCFREYVGVPVPTGEAVRGVLGVLSGQNVRFRAEEVHFLISVGEQMGALVEQARLRRKAEQLLVMEERNRLARELHDSVTQSLYSVTLFAEAGRRMAQSGNNVEAERYLSRVGETSQQALKEMRLLVHKLRPSILAQEGLVRALQNRLHAVEGRAGIQHELQAGGRFDLSPALEEALFHIAQEALNNALKHALAESVVVRLRQTGDQIVLEVQDDGRGFAPAEVGPGGLGLASMRERAELFGGNLMILTAPGEGTTIQVCLKEGPALAMPDLVNIL